MESMGAVKTVMTIWNECTNAYVETIVTDEDAVMRSKLSHFMAECVAIGTMMEAEQRYKTKTTRCLGAKKPGQSELPFDHPAINKLSDPIHYIKNHKSKINNLVKVAKSKSETCKAGAMRLSRNLAYPYIIVQHTRGMGSEDCTFEKFKAAAKASFEDHWNCHQHCGSWCQAKSWTEKE
jgi:hypothetical protein